VTSAWEVCWGQPGHGASRLERLLRGERLADHALDDPLLLLDHRRDQGARPELRVLDRRGVHVVERLDADRRPHGLRIPPDLDTAYRLRVRRRLRDVPVGIGEAQRATTPPQLVVHVCPDPVLAEERTLVERRLEDLRDA